MPPGPFPSLVWARGAFITVEIGPSWYTEQSDFTCSDSLRYSDELGARAGRSRLRAMPISMIQELLGD